MKIALFGCNGQVGWELQRALAPLGQLVCIDSKAAPLADPQVVAAVVQRVLDAAAPDVIVNAAAYTAVDKAESDQVAAWSVNARAPEAMARWAKARGALLIHYSTDYVFDGSGTHFRSEDEATSPVNAYGASKRDGELAILDAAGAHWIFRTSWVFGVRGGNFARTIVSRAQTQALLQVVNDQFGAPTSAWFIADATAQALARVLGASNAVFDEKLADSRRPMALCSYINSSVSNDSELSGLYHLVSADVCSWFDYAQMLVAEGRALRPDLRWAAVEPVSSAHYRTPAKRPANSRLDTRKASAAFGLHMPSWKHDVQRFMALQNLPSAVLAQSSP
jgi:dTDP-4-dehydrorhamnose reductase